jgi:2-dehydro-3-deoxyphosphooctonate aldolase (KDO 8-P synthase)
MSESKSKSLSKMTLIAGPCVIEDDGLLAEVSSELKRQLADLPVELYFKASFDKANRSSIEGFRGPGLKDGLAALERVKKSSGLPILTDFHTPDQAEEVARVADFLQIPAFLCRQTDMIVAGASAALKRGRRLNVKKGQFLAPWDARNIVEKVAQVVERDGVAPARKDWFCLTERGASFGYNALVVDMVSFQTMQGFGVPVIYDATHSIQMPGAGPGGPGAKSTGGKREYLETLARAAFAAGADGLFMECHPRPAQAKSDGPNAFYLEHVGTFIRQILEIRALVAGMPKLLPEARAGAAHQK